MQVQRDALCIHQAKQTKAKQPLLTTFKSTQPQPSQVSPRHATGAMFGGLVDGARLGDWAALVKEKGSYYVSTPNGYQQPHQAYYVARDKKRELLKWLPEAALTIPSFHKLKTEQLTPQGDLFGADPIEQFRQRKAKLGMRAIPGGKPHGDDD